MTIHSSFLDTIGNTPLVRFPRITAQLALHGDLIGKLEFFNPLASVKDRIGYAMIEAAEKSGKLTKDTTNIWQYRHCLGICGGGQRISTDLNYAGKYVD